MPQGVGVRFPSSAQKIKASHFFGKLFLFSLKTCLFHYIYQTIFELKATSFMNKKILVWSITVALAGFLFGFDTVVISGANQPIKEL